ncbi:MULTISPECIES: PepSY domain-containing protein [unclassified Sphingomonas]|uniref:PepSY domain-containing protein n=1 Tax=unclassified Sphingomonas TaxID=196159 RepID=UPI0009EC72A3|nr:MULTISPECIES: PepSY domain-containing protein [unclassified Sphingomonas]
MLRLSSVVAASLLLAAAAPAAADRGPTQSEAAAIAIKLTAQGFKSWNRIELDPDGPKWKVDDARKLDGKTYDVQLTVGTYEILKMDGD